MNQSPRQKDTPGNVTQKMVAARTGVSQGAVSHILNGKARGYSEQTCERIKQAAVEMGYRPNRAAQTMRRGKSNAIVHLNCGGYSELAGRISYHLGRFVHEAGFDYQAVDSYWWPEEGPRIVDRILSYRPEGLVISGSLQTKVDFSPLYTAEIPGVVMNGEVPGYPQVNKDIRGAMAELTRQCLAQGRRPALLLQRKAANIEHPLIAQRRKGFLGALREAGFQDVPEWKIGDDAAAPGGHAKYPSVVWSDQTWSPFAPFEDGGRIARWLHKKGCLPDALVCTNDFYALGVMGELAVAGLRMPEDIAVTGFDNLSYSTQRAVSLTTVEQPLEAMCAEAAALLKKQIAAGTPPAAESRIVITLPCHIHWRRSLPQTFPSPVARGNVPVPA